MKKPDLGSISLTLIYNASPRPVVHKWCIVATMRFSERYHKSLCSCDVLSGNKIYLKLGMYFWNAVGAQPRRTDNYPVIDLFTNVSQIYGMFLPSGPGNEPFHRPVPNNGISNLLGIHFAYISCCYVGQTSDKLSGCQEQPLLKWCA